LPGGNLQTVYAVLLGKRRRFRFERERWTTPDGDFIDVDRTDAQSEAERARPLVVLFHGLEGGSRSHYASSFARECVRLGWRCALPHFRGCSGEPNLLPRAYHSGDAAEIGWILRRFRERERGALFAAGISLGGNALLRWLGEDAAAHETLDGAAAVSAPMDLMVSGDALGRGFNLFYTRVFLATMKSKGSEKLARFPGLFDEAAMLRARTLREFDDVFTAPLHGFRDVNDYWTRASAKPWLGRIRVPTLLVNARNDPFLPARALPSPDEVSGAVRCEFPREGGHVGFVSGAFPGGLDWLPRRVAAFFGGLRPIRRRGSEPRSTGTVQSASSRGSDASSSV
jgi:predicted alpha/beta-fold hydrolase